MPNQPREGFRSHPRATEGEEDVEGHSLVKHPREGFRSHPRATEGEDVGGEGFRSHPRATEGEEDVEGHQMLPMDIGSARQLANARESEIRRHLQRHDLESEGRRPHNKRDR